MGLRGSTNSMDEIFPIQEQGIYIFKDPFDKQTGSATGKGIGTTYSGKVPVKFKREMPFQSAVGASDVPSSLSTTEAVVTPETIGATPSISGSDKKIIQEKLPKTVAGTIEQEGIKNRQLAFMQAGAQLFADVFNANSAYNAVAGEARLNIIQTRNQAADALYRGRQARMEAESEGRQAGESALLAMAAQGQDVQGSAVQKIQGSYEAMGVFNGMREEINAVREALGYELQEIAYGYQVRNAAIARESAIIGSAINFAASGIGTL
jgi:hypothetical protein